LVRLAFRIGCLVPILQPYVGSCAGLLHWFTSPYVRRLVYRRASGTAEVETLDVFARPVSVSFRVPADVEYADTLRPQTSFAVGLGQMSLNPKRRHASSAGLFLGEVRPSYRH
jgi:TMEM70/TMEM186/TMEM223 protein family